MFLREVPYIQTERYYHRTIFCKIRFLFTGGRGRPPLQGKAAIHQRPNFVQTLNLVQTMYLVRNFFTLHYYELASNKVLQNIEIFDFVLFCEVLITSYFAFGCPLQKEAHFCVLGQYTGRLKYIE